MKTLLTSLLVDWCDGLLRRQIDLPDDATRHGALLCPDCGFIHGRCGDALYPFLTQARLSGEEKWVRAALAVQQWSDQVSSPDGSWRNDVKGNTWDGITVFGTLALAEALHHHGDLLPEDDRARWTERLERAARWINAQDWSDKGSINYPISAAGALAAASRVLNDETSLTAARRWATWAHDFFLPDGILFGEGPRPPTARGFYAVDALYNLEESLPNLALYAEIAGDTKTRDVILRSFAAHLDFMLPDGSYDAGWCSRSFKWTLWGSRTSDGLAGLLPFARYDDRITEAVRRNVEQMRACTHDGLLHGGPHLRAYGRSPCIHHTFTHAKALASALDSGYLDAPRRDLPSDRPRGVIERPLLGVTLISRGAWRASFSVSDVFYQKRGAHASGGAMTMLWHSEAGPLCVSSMSRYDLIEGNNMAPVRSQNDTVVLTPRIEKGEFTSALDFKATLEASDTVIVSQGRLTNLDDETACEFRLETRFEDDAVHFHATGETSATFVLPVVSQSDEIVEWSDRRVEIRKERARVICETDGVFQGDASRIFHFTPGVQAVRLAVDVPAEGVKVILRVG